MLRAILVTIFSLLCVFFLGAPCLLYAVLSGNTDPLYEVFRISSKAVLWLSGVRTEVKGRENIPAGRAVVFMPNHQSNWDPPGIFVLLPPVLVIGKKEFFRVPVLGRAMRLRGFIPVDRANRERAIAAVEAASQALRAGHSFLAFPEGTRSRDGRLQAFKKGVFVMAMHAGAPIVPISISGSYRVMRKGEFAIHPGVVRVTFHEPVLTEGRDVDDRAQVMGEVRQAIISGLPEEERPLDAAPDDLTRLLM